MKKSLFTFFLLITFISYTKAQDAVSDTSGPNEPIFSFGLVASPTFSYRQLKALDESAKPNVETSNSKDLPALLFEAGARMNMRIGNRFRITTGALFSQKGYQTDIELTDTVTKTKLEGTYRAYTTNTLIEIPVYLSFAVAKDSNKTFYLLGGISNGFLMKRVYNYPGYDQSARAPFFEDNVINNEEDFVNRGYNTYLLAFMAGIEGNFKIANNVSLMVQPHFKYFTTPTRTKDFGIGKVIQENLFTVGITFGADFFF